MTSRQDVINTLKQSPTRLSVGVLTADLMNLSSEIEILKAAQVPMVHHDIMDGSVWPKFTASAPFLSSLTHDLLNDVHLLVKDPDAYIPAFAAAGADMISFCVEYSTDIGATLDLIDQASNTHHPDQPILRGAALEPATPVSVIEPHLEKIDFVLLQAIGPTTGKQSFFDDLKAKITTLRAAKEDLYIFIDGAIKKDNIGDVAQLGPDGIVSGSAVFDGNDAAANLAHMRQAMDGQPA